MKTRNILLVTLAVLIIIAGGVFAYWNNYLNTAHSSFGNYYAFRGCQKLVSRTDTFAVCVTDKGETITIVKYEDRWFLDGDLPCKTGICW